MLLSKMWVKMAEETAGEVPAGGGASGSDMNWEALDSEMTALETGEKPQPTTVEPPKVETPAVAAPVVVPAAPAPAEAPPQVPAPVVTPEQPTVPVQPQAPAEPATPTPTSEEIRTAEHQRLEGLYALNEADAASMITEPEKVIPRLAANLHMSVAESVINAVMANLPRVITHIQKTSVDSAAAEKAFYDKWPALNKPEYAQTVMNAAVAYRQMNPKASQEDVIKAAGLQAMISLQLPLPPEILGPQLVPTPPVQPFAPAAPASAGTAPVAPTGNTNPFTVMAQELIEDDRN